MARNQRKPYSETRINLEPGDPYHLSRYTYLLCSITVFGTEYPSVQSACKALGVCYQSTRRKLITIYREAILADDGWAHPAPEAINRAFFPNHIFVKGTLFKSITEAARHFDIPYRYARSAFHRIQDPDNHQDDIDAIFDREQYLKRSRQNSQVFVRGKWYPHQSAACKAHGVDQQTVIRKLLKLNNPSQAQIDALFDPPDTHTRNPKRIVVRGVEYPSVTAACRTLGFRQSTVDARLKRIPERSPEWIDRCFSKEPLPRPE